MPVATGVRAGRPVTRSTSVFSNRGCNRNLQQKPATGTVSKKIKTERVPERSKNALPRPAFIALPSSPRDGDLPSPAWLRLRPSHSVGWQRRLAILPRRLAAALRRRLGRDQEVGDVRHPRAAVAEEDLPDGCLGFQCWPTVYSVYALRIDVCTGRPGVCLSVPGRVCLSAHSII